MMFTTLKDMLIADIPWILCKKNHEGFVFWNEKLFHISSMTMFFQIKFVRILYKMPKWFWCIQMIFSFFKALEKEGYDHEYSIFSKTKKYEEMMCKLFEKKFTAIKIMENTLQHLQFALTWPSMTYVLMVHRML